MLRSLTMGHTGIGTSDFEKKQRFGFPSFFSPLQNKTCKARMISGCLLPLLRVSRAKRWHGWCFLLLLSLCVLTQPGTGLQECAEQIQKPTSAPYGGSCFSQSPVLQGVIGSAGHPLWTQPCGLFCSFSPLHFPMFSALFLSNVGCSEMKPLAVQLKIEFNSTLPQSTITNPLGHLLLPFPR